MCRLLLIHVPQTYLDIALLVGALTLSVFLVLVPATLILAPIVVVERSHAVLTVFQPVAFVAVARYIQHSALAGHMAVVELARVHGPVLPDKSALSMLLTSFEIAFIQACIFVDIGTAAFLGVSPG